MSGLLALWFAFCFVMGVVITLIKWRREQQQYVKSMIELNKILNNNYIQQDKIEP